MKFPKIVVRNRIFSLGAGAGVGVLGNGIWGRKGGGDENLAAISVKIKTLYVHIEGFMQSASIDANI